MSKKSKNPSSKWEDVAEEARDEEKDAHGEETVSLDDILKTSETAKDEELDSALTYEDLQTQVRKETQRADEYWDKFVRLQAEFDNVKKRSERDVANAHKYALERFVENLLPVLDSLERALDACGDAESHAASMREGVELTLKVFLDALKKHGVIQLNPAVGTAFDPAHHEAMSMQESAEHAPNSVIAVVARGYTLNERLVRPAMVVVTKAAK